MNKNLSDYVKIYNLVSKDLCERTISELKSFDEQDDVWIEHRFTDNSTYASVSLSPGKELSVTRKPTSTLPFLMQKVRTGLDYYFKRDLHFHWQSYWTGVSDIRFNKYSKNTEMAEHADHIHDLFDGKRKGIPYLSVIMLLNDDFKGGEFVMFQDEVISLKQGDILFFPSIFMYPHTVKEVTEGTRYSGVSWVW